MADFGEKSFVASLPALIPEAGVAAMLDDVGIVEVKPGVRLAMTTDRGPSAVARKLGFAGREADGRLAAVASISDLLAGGARPTALTLALSAPGRSEVSEVNSVVAAFAETCAEYGAMFVGGDTKRGHWNLVSTGVGTLSGPSQKRHRGRAGDVLLLGGTVGGFATSLLALTRNAGRKQKAITYLSRPSARWQEASWVRENVTVRSATDASDGVFEAIKNVLAPGCGAVVDGDAVPYVRESAAFCRLLKLPPQALLSTGGDWNLLYAVPPNQLARARSASSAAGLVLRVVGKVTNDGQLNYVTSERGSEELRGVVSDHFRNRIEDVSSYGAALAKTFQD